MRPALLLVDLQSDFLAAEGLDPPAETIVAGAARLLERCREAGVPVIHVRTTVTREPDNRMPHWRASGTWRCVAGTPGHRFPDALRPRGEPVLDKVFYGAFSCPLLEPALRELEASEVILAGVHLHACVRETALGAYERGFEILIAEGAVGSYDPEHAALTRRWLGKRAARFLAVDRVLERIAAAAR
jgi:nicotinamidase-related amidase